MYNLIRIGRIEEIMCTALNLPLSEGFVFVAGGRTRTDSRNGFCVYISESAYDKNPGICIEQNVDLRKDGYTGFEVIGVHQSALREFLRSRADYILGRKAL